jgi:addiction module HigA family antidote
VLPALALTVSQAARELAVTRQTLHRILAGTAAITPDMAVRLEQLCGVSSRFWLDRQCRHDLPRARAGCRTLARIPSYELPQEVIRKIGADDGQ